ncbi:MAG: SHOCT domain-containing protein [Stenotrophomonas sp.]|uniref:SHOCT domain-containing protein n=1 Tax=Stenotrophomonas sp. TaxID=69392 RepID=UPI003D6CFA8B
MGTFSIWHWLVLLFLFAVLVGGIGGIVWLVSRAAKSSPRPAASSTTESRLQQLEVLKTKGLISEAEYAQQRAAIVSGI